MGKIAYAYADLIKSLAGASITITSEDANYPDTNLQNEQIALCTRTTAKVAIKLQITLSAAATPQFFFIGNHNFSGGTYDIYSYTAANFVTGQTAVETNKAIRLLDMYHRESSAPASRQYWEWDFTNCTSADTYFEIGRAMIVLDYVTITDIEDYVVPRGYGFRNIINETMYGVRWVHKLAEKREGFELIWNERTVANAIHTELRTLYQTVYGDASPFVYIPDLSGIPCYYVYIADPELLYNEIFGLTAGHIGAIKLRLIEAVRGKV